LSTVEFDKDRLISQNPGYADDESNDSELYEPSNAVSVNEGIAVNDLYNDFQPPGPDDEPGGVELVKPDKPDNASIIEPNIDLDNVAIHCQRASPAPLLLRNHPVQSNCGSVYNFSDTK
jgi:hypothetical protein